MKYLSVRQTSEFWGISIRHIQIHCYENRISRTVWKDYACIISDDELKDERIKSRKYIRSQKV